MQRIVADGVAWSVTIMSPAEMADPIEIPFDGLKWAQGIMY